MRTRITHVILTPGVDGEGQIPFIENAEVQVDGNLIAYAGPMESAPFFAADETIDGTGRLCMPGLINLHTHTPMTFLRSVGADLTLDDWLHKAIFPLEKQWDEGLIRTATDLGCMEMLRFGTTSFNDMYFYTNAMAETVRDNGMRALLGHGIVDFDESCADMVEGVAMAEKWNRTCNDRIRFSLAPHSEGATTPKLIRKVADTAKQMGLPIHIHVSETDFDLQGCLKRRGVTPPAYLEQMGILDSPVIAAHCVWFNDADIEIFRKHGVTIAHNPVSNLKLASGIAPIAKMLKAECKVALGTDGVASNNNLNLWEELKLMPMLQKGTTLDPTVVTPAQTLAAATVAGAKAMGYDRLGLLRQGYLADLILLDLNTPQMTPRTDLESNLIYSAQGSDVCLTMVDGKVLYRNGQFTTLDPADLLRRAQAGALEMRRRLANA
ncbi:MAG TPA: amidohydrolase [Candidatus Limiplasma sp.]|nr:amidohydrolase [Candidatus Limiplasma sp.]HPS80940.1 amidohydrolase [Candidatus Limiplasma sp.]